MAPVSSCQLEVELQPCLELRTGAVKGPSHVPLFGVLVPGHTSQHVNLLKKIAVCWCYHTFQIPPYTGHSSVQLANTYWEQILHHLPQPPKCTIIHLVSFAALPVSFMFCLKGWKWWSWCWDKQTKLKKTDNTCFLSDMDSALYVKYVSWGKRTSKRKEGHQTDIRYKYW